MNPAYRFLGLDLRSVAAFRVALGLMLLGGLPQRMQVLSSHESNGVALQFALFAIAASVATLLLLGWNSRLMALIGCIFLSVTQANGPSSPDLGDNVLLTTLFLAMFLPIGARYSMDQAMDPDTDPRQPHLFLATILFLALMILSCVFAARGMLGPHSAWIITTLLIILAPTFAWNWLNQRTELTRHNGLHVYYDRDCTFCHKICLLFRTFLILNATTIRPAQNSEQVYEIMTRDDTWVVYDYDGHVYLRWHAILLLLRRSPLAWPLGYLLTAIGMGSWGAFLYKLIASARTWLSKVAAIVLPFRRRKIDMPRIANILLAVYVILLLAASDHIPSSYVIPGAQTIRSTPMNLDRRHDDTSAQNRKFPTALNVISSNPIAMLPDSIPTILVLDRP